jgi:adenylate kinase family enzyme
LFDYYKAANVLNVVDGTRDTEAIYQDIEKIVKTSGQ